jgi:hypothetical protein
MRQQRVDDCRLRLRLEPESGLERCEPAQLRALEGRHDLRPRLPRHHGGAESVHRVDEQEVRAPVL